LNSQLRFCHPAIVQTAVDDLVLYKGNARTHSRRQIAQIAEPGGNGFLRITTTVAGRIFRSARMRHSAGRLRRSKQSHPFPFSVVYITVTFESDFRQGQVEKHPLEQIQDASFPSAVALTDAMTVSLPQHSWILPSMSFRIV
jgi:hypothetical protein